MMKTKFRDLETNATFVFSSERDFPFSGMARGPWVKTRRRKYRKLHGINPVDYTVGSINVEVIRVPDTLHAG